MKTIPKSSLPKGGEASLMAEIQILKQLVYLNYKLWILLIIFNFIESPKYIETIWVLLGWKKLLYNYRVSYDYKLFNFYEPLYFNQIN